MTFFFHFTKKKGYPKLTPSMEFSILAVVFQPDIFFNHRSQVNSTAQLNKLYLYFTPVFFTLVYYHPLLCYPLEMELSNSFCFVKYLFYLVNKLLVFILTFKKSIIIGFFWMLLYKITHDEMNQDWLKFNLAIN